MPKGFPTFDTLIRSVSSVNPVMFTKVCLLAESSFTLTALIKFLSSVSSLMFNKGGVLSEGFTTFLTYVGLLS